MLRNSGCLKESQVFLRLSSGILPEEKGGMLTEPRISYRYIGRFNENDNPEQKLFALII